MKRQIFQAWLLAESDTRAFISSADAADLEGNATFGEKTQDISSHRLTNLTLPAWGPLLQECKEAWMERTNSNIQCVLEFLTLWFSIFHSERRIPVAT